MTRGHFAPVANEALETIRKEERIYDVMLMMGLDFTPENWKVWKPKLIELFSVVTYDKEEPQNEIVKEKVIYDKKQKLWYMQDIE